MLKFQHPEDRAFFQQLLGSEDLQAFHLMFDFRSSNIKRREFATLRQGSVAELVRRFGESCMLHFAPDCDSLSGLVIDHLIPLSSNKLNKHLRRIGAYRTASGKLKKVTTQSFGSNHISNLVLACRNCNSFKQNKFLPVEKMKHLLSIKAGL